MNLMRRAFSTKNGDPKRRWLIDELLEEDPRRVAWLELSYEQVFALFQEATRLYEDKKVPFKSIFKKLLNRATAKERVVTDKKIERTQAEIDDENHRLWLEAQERGREYAERKRQTSPPGGGRGCSRSKREDAHERPFSHAEPPSGALGQARVYPGPQNDRERILGELKALSPLPLTNLDIAEELNITTGRARKLLLQLQRAGEVAEKGTAKPTQVKLYYLPEGQREWIPPTRCCGRTTCRGSYSRARRGTSSAS